MDVKKLKYHINMEIKFKTKHNTSSMKYVLNKTKRHMYSYCTVRPSFINLYLEGT